MPKLSSVIEAQQFDHATLMRVFEIAGEMESDQDLVPGHLPHPCSTRTSGAHWLAYEHLRRLHSCGHDHAQRGRHL